MAPTVKTVLSQHDFTGRTVIPFMTHAGWPGHTLRDMAAACKNAAIAAAKEIRFDGSGGATLVTPRQEVDKGVEEGREIGL